MIHIEFSYDGEIVIMQANLNQKYKDVLISLENKINININSVYSLYNGESIGNIELNINEIINNNDKERKKMNIQIININNDDIQMNSIIKSEQIICPICNENIIIKIEDYKIDLYDCRNGHNINNITLDEFNKNQQIDLEKIKCDKCIVTNKLNSYKKMFYICNECNMNLCPICADQHDKNHTIINYDDKNYICKKHNIPYTIYCNDCKKDICYLCEIDHNSHNIVSYGKILPNKEELNKKMKDIRIKINIFINDIKNMINKLQKVIENIEILYKINEKNCR